MRVSAYMSKNRGSSTGIYASYGVYILVCIVINLKKTSHINYIILFKHFYFFE